MNKIDFDIITEFEYFIQDEAFPCVAAKAAVDRSQVKCLVVGNMGCPRKKTATI